MDFSTEQVITHTLKLTDAELAEIREAAKCAIDLGGATDEHLPVWRSLARLGLSAIRGTAAA
ncbi:hypothetical protein ABZ312_11475 [Streptomyces sp. NPDC006207]